MLNDESYEDLLGNDTLRLTQLILANFRCFEWCELDLHSSLTTLVADNGHGKTAILDALGIALGAFIDGIRSEPTNYRLAREDIRRFRDTSGTMIQASSTTVYAKGVGLARPITWKRELRGNRARARNTSKDAKPLEHIGATLRHQLREFSEGTNPTPPTLPLLAFYGTGRLWTKERLTAARKRRDTSALGRLMGYKDCLTSSSSFGAFVHWYKSMATMLRQGSTSMALGPDERPEKLLAAVREAIKTVLEPTGWQDLDWDFDQNELVAEHPQRGRLSLSMLSDGVQNMVALVADMAHRCAQLNPHFGEEAALKTPGIALIDEVDMHLHPRWQQRIIELLREAFPLVQLVVSTHSPHVLSTVDKECVRVIRVCDGEATLETPTFQTRGVVSADVLAEIMNVDPVPQVEEARWASDYRSLIQTGHYDGEAGKELWKKLLKHFGEAHPIIQDLKTHQSLQEFKRRHNLPVLGGG
ncbi:MAG: AAA family ATPase [Byssovorax sp.]